MNIQPDSSALKYPPQRDSSPAGIDRRLPAESTDRWSPPSTDDATIMATLHQLHESGQLSPEERAVLAKIVARHSSSTRDLALSGPSAGRAEGSALQELSAIHPLFQEALKSADEVVNAAKRKFGCVHLYLQADTTGRITGIPQLSIERDPVTLLVERSDFHRGKVSIPYLDKVYVDFCLPNWASMDIHEVLNPQFAEFGTADIIGRPQKKDGLIRVASFEMEEDSSKKGIFRAEFRNQNNAIDPTTWKRFGEILSKEGKELGLTIASSGTSGWIPFQVPCTDANHPYGILALCERALSAAYEPPPAGLFRRRPQGSVSHPIVDLNLEVNEFFDAFACSRIFTRLEALDTDRTARFGLSATAAEWTTRFGKLLEPAGDPQGYWDPNHVGWMLGMKREEFSFTQGQLAQECPPFQEFYRSVQHLTEAWKTLPPEEQRATCAEALRRFDQGLSTHLSGRG